MRRCKNTVCVFVLRARATLRCCRRVLVCRGSNLLHDHISTRSVQILPLALSLRSRETHLESKFRAHQFSYSSRSLCWCNGPANPIAFQSSCSLDSRVGKPLYSLRAVTWPFISSNLLSSWPRTVSTQSISWCGDEMSGVSDVVAGLVSSLLAST